MADTIGAPTQEGAIEQAMVEQIAPDPLFDNLLLDEGLVQAFFNNFLPLPVGITNRVELTHYLLSNWAEFEATLGLVGRKVFFLPLRINTQRIIPVQREDGTTPELKSSAANTALDIAANYPEQLLPIQGTPFVVCIYPCREYIRTFKNGQRGFEEIGYCIMIIDYSEQQEAIPEEA